MKAIIIPALLLFGAISLPAQSPKVVNVCELFSDMARWNGELVQFEAKIEKGGGEEGPVINALECPTKVKIGEVEFPDGLLIINPQSPTRLHDVAFEFDPQASARFGAPRLP